TGEKRRRAGRAARPLRFVRTSRPVPSPPACGGRLPNHGPGRITVPCRRRGAALPPLVVGTRNPKKRQGIFEILGAIIPDPLDLTQYPDAPEVVEDGETFEANARKKAVELARFLGAWVLGEDSGLVVPALNGRPGVYSARYAGKQGDDAANNAR